MEEITDKALCPRCGNDEFTVEMRLNVKSVCTECEWAVNPEQLADAVDTPQRRNGDTATLNA